MNSWQQTHGHKRRIQEDAAWYWGPSPTSTAVFTFVIVMVSRLVSFTVAELLLGSLSVLLLVCDGQVPVPDTS